MRYGMNQKLLQNEQEWQDWVKENEINPDLDKPEGFPCIVVWNFDDEYDFAYVEYVHPVLSINLNFHLDLRIPEHRESMLRLTKSMEEFKCVKFNHINNDTSEESLPSWKNLKRK